jgi:hypothetical protein
VDWIYLETAQILNCQWLTFNNLYIAIIPCSLEVDWCQFVFYWFHLVNKLILMLIRFLIDFLSCLLDFLRCWLILFYFLPWLFESHFILSNMPLNEYKND